MATPAIQPDPSQVMVDVFSPPDKDNPNGVKGKVPASQLQDFMSKGFQRAVSVTTPEGTGGWLPTSLVGSYLKQGFHLGPPNQQGDLTGNIAQAQKDNSSVFGGIGNRIVSTVKGAGSLLDPRPKGAVVNPATGATEVDLGAFSPYTIPQRLIRGQLAASQKAVQQAKGQYQTASNTSDAVNKPLGYARATVTGLSALDPFASASVTNVNDLADQGKLREAAGQGLVDITGLASGSRTLKGPQAIEAGTQLAKRGINSAVQTVKTASNPVAASETLPAETLAIKATKPRNSINNVQQQMQTALPDVRRAADSMGLDVENGITLDDARNATLRAKQDVWNEYSNNHLEPGQKSGAVIDGNKIADAMTSKITRTMELENPAKAQAIRETANLYRKPISLSEAEQFLQDSNNALNSYYAKTKVSQRVAARDPETGPEVAKADALRQELNSKLNDITGPGAQQLKQRYGALNMLEDVLNRRINVAERQAPESLIEQMAKKDAAIGVGKGVVKIATGRPLSGAADIYGAYKGVQAAKASRQANDSNFLISKALEKTQPTPPAVLREQPQNPLMQLLSGQAKQPAPTIPPSRQLPAAGLPQQSGSTLMDMLRGRNVETAGIPESAEEPALRNYLNPPNVIKSKTGAVQASTKQVIDKAGFQQMGQPIGNMVKIIDPQNPQAGPATMTIQEIQKGGIPAIRRRMQNGAQPAAPKPKAATTSLDAFQRAVNDVDGTGKDFDELTPQQQDRVIELAQIYKLGRK